MLIQILSFSYLFLRGEFKTQSNICDGAFCENS